MDKQKFGPIHELFQFYVRRTSVYSGIGSADCLPLIAEGLGGRRVVLFTDEGLVKAGVADKIRRIFENGDGSVVLAGVFDAVKPDAAVGDILEGVRYFREVSGDVLLGVGGGSVLDSVKMVKWLLCHPDTDIYEYFGDETLLIEKWPAAKPMPVAHIAVTTAPGTGTEISTTSVVQNEKNGLKCALMDPYIGADIALLDAKITESLPARLTADTGFDAFTHAFEAFFSPKANCLSDSHAKEAMKVLAKYLPVCVKNGHDLEARQMVLLGNIMAISAFGLVKNRTPVHNVAVALGNRYHVSHGFANAVAMVPVLEALPDCYAPRAAEFLAAVGEKAPEADAYAAMLAWMRAFRDGLSIPAKVASMKLDAAALADMVKEIYKAPSARYYHIPEDAAAYIIRRLSYEA